MGKIKTIDVIRFMRDKGKAAGALGKKAGLHYSTSQRADDVITEIEDAQNGVLGSPPTETMPAKVVGDARANMVFGRADGQDTEGLHSALQFSLGLESDTLHTPEEEQDLRDRIANFRLPDMPKQSTIQRAVRIGSEALATRKPMLNRIKNLMEILFTPTANIGVRSSEALNQYIMNLSDGNMDVLDRSIKHRLFPELFTPATEEATMRFSRTPAVDGFLSIIDISNEFTKTAVGNARENKPLMQDVFEVLDENRDLFERMDFIIAEDVMRHMMGSAHYDEVREKVGGFPYLGRHAIVAWDLGEFAWDLFADPNLVMEGAPMVGRWLSKKLGPGGVATQIASEMKTVKTIGMSAQMADLADDTVALAVKKMDNVDPKNVKDLAKAQLDFAQAVNTQKKVRDINERHISSSGGIASDILVTKSPIKKPSLILAQSHREEFKTVAEESRKASAAAGGYMDELLNDATNQGLKKGMFSDAVVDEMATDLVKATRRVIAERDATLRGASFARRQRDVFMSEKRAGRLGPEEQDQLANVESYLIESQKELKRLRGARNALQKDIKNVDSSVLAAAHRLIGEEDAAKAIEKNLDEAMDVSFKKLGRTGESIRTDLRPEPPLDPLKEGLNLPGAARKRQGSRIKLGAEKGKAFKMDKVTQGLKSGVRLEKKLRESKAAASFDHPGAIERVAELEGRISANNKTMMDLLMGRTSLSPKGHLVKNPQAQRLFESAEGMRDRAHWLGQAFKRDPSVKSDRFFIPGTPAEVTKTGVTKASGAEFPNDFINVLRDPVIEKKMAEFVFGARKALMKEANIVETANKAGPMIQKLLHEEILLTRLAAAMEEPKLWPVIRGTSPEDFNAMVTRSLQGPANYEEFGDLLGRVAAGADPGDITMQMMMHQEYDPTPLYQINPKVFTHPIGPGDVLKKGESKRLASAFDDELNNPANTAEGWLPTPSLSDLEAQELHVARKYFAENPEQLERLNKKFADAVSLRSDPAMHIAKGIDELTEKAARQMAKIEALVEQRPDILMPGMVKGTSFARSINDHRRFLGKFREYPRVLEKYPRAVERIRSAQMRRDASVSANSEMLHEILEEASIIHGPLKRVDNKADARMGAILNTNPITQPKRLLKLLNAESPEFVKAASKLRSWLDDMANSMGIHNAESNKGGYVSGYFPNMFDWDDMITPRHFAEMDGMRPSAEVFLAHLIQRKGKLPDGVIKLSAVDVLDLFNRRKHNKTIMEPMFADALAMSTRMDPASREYVNVLINGFKGKPMAADRVMGSDRLWRKGTRAAGSVVNLFYHGLLMGRPGYVMMAFATSAATTAGRLGGLSTLQGIGKMMTLRGRRLAASTGIDETFAGLFGTTGAANTALRALDKVPFLGLNSVEFNIRGMSMHASMAQSMRQMGLKNWDEAVERGLNERIMLDALRDSEDINHLFGIAGRAPMFTEMFGTGAARQTAMQFHMFSLKQLEELSSQLRKNPGMFARYIMYSGFIARVMRDMGNIDTSEYTGMAFVTQFGARAGGRGDLAGPAFKTMEGMLKLNFQIGEGADPVLIKETAEELGKNMQLMVPAALAIQQGRRATAELRDRKEGKPAKQRDSKGRLMRDRDLGPENPTFAQKFGFGRKNNSELLGVSLSVPTIQSSLHKEATNRAFETLSHERFRAEQFMDEFIDILEGDAPDTDRLRKIVREMAKEGIAMPDPSGGAESAIEARYIRQLMRLTLRSKGKAEVFEQVQKFNRALEAMERNQ